MLLIASHWILNNNQNRLVQTVMKKKPREPLTPSRHGLLVVAAIVVITLVFVTMRLYPQLVD